MEFSGTLKKWILEALAASGGESSVIDVHKYVWSHHESDLRDAGDHFYKWQYEIRWAAQLLRDEGLLVYPKRGTWALTETATSG